MKKRTTTKPAAKVRKPESKAPATTAEVKIRPAKGRPMLVWVGKRPLTRVVGFPAQKLEAYGAEADAAPLWSDWPTATPRTGLLFHGENKDVLGNLLANGFRGKVKLIYIDPPFDSGADYVRRVSLRGATGMAKIGGEEYSLGEQIQYTDIWANDNYLQFMFERLLLLRELLADGGGIFLHCDASRGHQLRSIMDEVFGPEKFLNEIVWSYRRWPSNTDAFQSMHDTILYYVNDISEKHTFHREYEEASESYMKRFGGKSQRLDEETRTRKITSEEETKGMPLRDVWDISIIAGFKGERTSYPTQKPEELVERIIRCCSNPGDIVLDCFAGSGTTAAVAQRLGRRWIACDINRGSIQTTCKRLIDVMRAQSNDTEEPEMIAGGPASPSQLGFTVYRVNDYDLHLQQSEAVNIACEHLGVERTRTDGFFDGTLGRSLVKIIPLEHPLTPLDLEEVRKELESRPDEDRPITAVCLGIEASARSWIEDWNRLRKSKDGLNRIEVIELRTDPKFGRFITHQAAKARVTFTRKDREVSIKIVDFVSPTIVERLNQQSGILKPKIDDWRSMVDCVLIDPQFNGKVFQIKSADIPEDKNSFVAGQYEVESTGRVALKIIDMLGEEVLVLESAK